MIVKMMIIFLESWSSRPRTNHKEEGGGGEGEGSTTQGDKNSTTAKTERMQHNPIQVSMNPGRGSSSPLVTAFSTPPVGVCSF